MKKLLFICLFIFYIIPVSAETQVTTPLKVGTKIAPPFAMKDKEGNWEGISIELWKQVATNLHLTYTFVEKKDIAHLLSSVEENSLDVGIAAITITAPRETKFDFSHSYYTTGLGIAVPKKTDNAWIAVLKAFFSFKMLLIVSLLLFILFIIGSMTWFMERKENPKNFHPNPIKGIASGIWWAAVTMTTVGYGDMTPKTIGGRLVALLWMFASMLLVSSVIAIVASTLTLAKLEPMISGPNDLAKVKSATIEASISETYLKNRRLHFAYYNTIYDGLEAVQKGEVETMIYDESLLKYMIKEHFSETLMVIDTIFENQNYAIAFPEKSILRENVNRELLKIIHHEAWQNILKDYLGS